MGIETGRAIPRGIPYYTDRGMNKMNPEISFETDNSKLGFAEFLTLKQKLASQTAP